MSAGTRADAGRFLDALSWMARLGGRRRVLAIIAQWRNSYFAT
jgi:hypothetical protein